MDRREEGKEEKTKRWGGEKGKGVRKGGNERGVEEGEGRGDGGGRERRCQLQITEQGTSKH